MEGTMVVRSLYVICTAALFSVMMVLLMSGKPFICRPPAVIQIAIAADKEIGDDEIGNSSVKMTADGCFAFPVAEGRGKKGNVVTAHRQNF